MARFRNRKSLGENYFKQNNIRDGYHASSDSDDSTEQSCKYCKKTNHASDRCYFKHMQRNQNRPTRGQVHNQHKTKLKQGSRKICNYCGKKGHIDTECYRKTDGGQHYNGQPFNANQSLYCTFCRAQGHLQGNCAMQSYNLTEYCAVCRQQGHIEIVCPNKAPRGDGLSRSRIEREPLGKPAQGNTPGQYGNPLAYELPLRIVRREIVVDRESSYGMDWTTTEHEYFVVDLEDDVLMCDCDGNFTNCLGARAHSAMGIDDVSMCDCNGRFTGCLSACAQDMYSQQGTTWISSQGRRALEKGMWNNCSTRIEDMLYGPNRMF